MSSQQDNYYRMLFSTRSRAIPTALSLSLCIAFMGNVSWAKKPSIAAQALPTTLEEQLQGSGMALMSIAEPDGASSTHQTRSDDDVRLDNSPLQKANPALAQTPESEPIKAKAVVVDINSNTLNYDEEKQVYTALGNVHLMVSEQNSELIADKITYDQTNDIVIAEGKVTIIKHGKKTHGVYAKIDLKRESALISEARTKVEGIRVTAKSAVVDPNITHLKDGRLIITKDLMASASGNTSSKAPKKGNASSRAQANSVLAVADSTSTSGTPRKGKRVKGQVNKTARAPEYMGENPLANLAVNSRALSSESLDLNDNNNQSNWSIKAKTINITRHEDGIADLQLEKASLHWKGHKLLRLVADEYAYNEATGEIDYLGPDLGYDPDYGGFYYGPGWDTRLGQGFFRFSPIASYGGTGRRRRGGSRFEKNGIGPGLGAVAHYRSEDLLVDAAYNTRVEQPVLWLERKLFDGKTRFQAGVNNDYTNGFLSYERPGAVVQLTDQRKVFENKWTRIDTFGSIGAAKDDFFPNNERNFFVDASDISNSNGRNLSELDPATAGRIQLQARIRNPKPLFKRGTWFRAGYQAQLASAAYTTGDFVGIFRFGPSVRFRYKNRLSSGLRYMHAFSAGKSPFIFDSYYLGRKSMNINNSVRINDFLSVGAWHILSLDKDNSRNALFTGNALYALAGPKNVKFNVAYDFVRKRSYFGINFYPSGKETAIDFDELNMISPTNFRAPISP